MNEKNSVRMSDAAVRAKTGKTWPEWFKILDAAGAKKMNHKQIVAFIKDKYNLGPWWQQMVTVTYEQARGMREKHQKPTGYEVSASKTITVSLARLYKAWSDKKVRAQWLADADYTIRKATPKKSMRITWSDGKTSVEVNFYEKGDGKSQVTVQHGKLANATEAKRMQAYWKKKLQGLLTVLGP